MKKLRTTLAFLTLFGMACAQGPNQEPTAEKVEDTKIEQVVVEPIAPVNSLRSYVIPSDDVSPEVDFFVYDFDQQGFFFKASDYEGVNRGLNNLEIHGPNGLMERYIVDGELDFSATYPFTPNSELEIYTLTATDMGGNRSLSSPLEINLDLALKQDKPPEFKFIYFDVGERRLSVSAKEPYFSQNKGLLRVVIFENNEPWKKFPVFGKEKFYATISLADRVSQEPVTYFAEATDIGGQTTRSEAISIRLGN